MIRVFASMPEAVAFAILFGNLITSQLDKALVRRQHVKSVFRFAPVAITFALAVGASTGVTLMKAVDKGGDTVEVTAPKEADPHDVLNTYT